MMNKKIRIWPRLLILIGLVLIFPTSCNKGEEKDKGQPPVLSTGNLLSVKATTASCGGVITDDGGAAVTARGVCWSTIQNPTINDSKTDDGTGRGFFKSEITGLKPETIYYVKAYATNNKGTSYGNELLFKTFTGTVADVEGNIYNIIAIGTQIWMAENLKTTKYNDNTAIPLVADNDMWAELFTPGYCWYDNDENTYKASNGALYNWYSLDSVSNGGKNVCPAGWHVPTDSEWTVLSTFLGGESVAGGKMKETGTANWQSPNRSATNVSGFTALPGGGRYYNGTFSNIGTIGGWWSSTELLGWGARGRYLYFDYSLIYSGFGSKQDGFSIRCLRDN